MLDNAATDSPLVAYAEPVSQLLTVGDANVFRAVDWPDYPEQYGFASEHVPELIRMACDMSLHDADTDTPEVWAPVHAWRALAQLRPAEAVEPLVGLMRTLLHDDAITQEFPEVFGRIGSAAIPALTSRLNDRSVEWLPAALAGGGLAEIGTRHPECRDECVGILVGALEHAAERDPEIIGDVISDLIHLKAVEAIDTIREAFRIDAVDASICGDLEDVEIDLGLREHRDTPPPRFRCCRSGAHRGRRGRAMTMTRRTGSSLLDPRRSGATSLVLAVAEGNSKSAASIRAAFSTRSTRM